MHHSRLILKVCCLLIALVMSSVLQAQDIETFESPILAMTESDLSQGQGLFQVHCARCHGMQGGGGEGPALSRPRLTHAPDDQALYAVISQGIPGTGMPATWAPRPRDLWKIAGYVRSLGRLADEAMPGDPVNGRAVYESNGNCASCHILNGQGKGVGPELSEVGLRRNADYLRQSITNPDADQPKVTTQSRGTINSFLTVRAVSEYGSFEGMRIYEDEFSVQMRDLNGRIYSFEKSALTSYERDFGHSLMPGYGVILEDAEVDDVVSYLMSLKGDAR